MSEDDTGDARHRHESELLREQEHKGYGDDEGEREEALPDGPDDEQQKSG